MVQDSPSRRQDQFVLRLPSGMRDRIAEAAKSNNRSMNAEIVARLEESFDRSSENLIPRAVVEESEQRLRLMIDTVEGVYQRALELAAERIRALGGELEPVPNAAEDPISRESTARRIERRARERASQKPINQHRDDPEGAN